MKWASKIGLFVSLGCFLTGVGGIAAPALRDSFRSLPPPSPREEPLPPVTPVSPPDSNAPRFTVHPLNGDIAPNVFQAYALNNHGDILCAVEERKPYEAMTRPGRMPVTRYRTVRTRYLIYRKGKLLPVITSTDAHPFRPTAFNDQSQVLGLTYHPNDVYKPEDFKRGNGSKRSSDPLHNSDPFRNGSFPVLRKSRVVLWENGVLHDLRIQDALIKAGMPSRFLPFLETASLSMNARSQILIALQTLYLYTDGKIQRVGVGNIGSGERYFINDKGSVIRRADQYRAAPDGISFYPMFALYQPNQPAPELLDFGYGSYPLDLNNKDQVLLSRLFAPHPEVQRSQFSLWDGNQKHTLFTVNGRTPARINGQGIIVAWRTAEGSSNWFSLLSSPSSHSDNTIPVLWNRGKLYDLQTLMPSGWQVVNIIDINERNEMLVQARRNGKLHILLLTPTEQSA